MALDDLLGRTFETQDGTRMRFVGYDLRERTARLLPQQPYSNTVVYVPSQVVPLHTFNLALSEGALVEV